MFYKKGKKYINPVLKDYLNAQALAIWIMDDGGWAKPGVRIARNSFELKEVTFWSKILHNNFNLAAWQVKFSILNLLTDDLYI